MFKPLLAATCEDVSALKFPLMASPKLDGIRAMVIDGVLVSRTLKPIPNDYVRGLFSQPELEGMDGELISGDPTDPKAFNLTTGDVMRKVGTPQVMFHVFDCMRDPNARFLDRLKLAHDITVGFDRVKMVQHTPLTSALDFEHLEEEWVAAGYEGVMLRDPYGPYKFGRSTLKAQTLMKVKRFTDDEAVILDCIEGEHNGNEATKDAFGRTERSSHKANMVKTGMLGSLRVRNTAGQEFNVGTGFDTETRKKIWGEFVIDRQKMLTSPPFTDPSWVACTVLGKTIKYRHQPAGAKDLPRFPSYIGFRED